MQRENPVAPKTSGYHFIRCRCWKLISQSCIINRRLQTFHGALIIRKECRIDVFVLLRSSAQTWNNQTEFIVVYKILQMNCILTITKRKKKPWIIFYVSTKANKKGIKPSTTKILTKCCQYIKHFFDYEFCNWWDTFEMYWSEENCGIK